MICIYEKYFDLVLHNWRDIVFKLNNLNINESIVGLNINNIFLNTHLSFICIHSHHRHLSLNRCFPLRLKLGKESLTAPLEKHLFTQRRHNGCSVSISRLVYFQWITRFSSDWPISSKTIFYMKIAGSMLLSIKGKLCNPT